jgi:NAD(P)-dependent dehydrogenase (short-subunit alcohol dehydrogenase family)
VRGKAVLIADGTGGLGVAVTQAALAQGAVVTVTYLVDAELEPARAAAGVGAAVTFVKADVGSEAAVQTLIAGLPRVDALIQLVGGFAMSPTAETTLADFQRQLDINLITTFLLCKHVWPKMQLQDYGRIVTIGSRTAVAPSAQTAAYAASKAGVIALTQAIADETRGTGVTANCVLPSVIDTPANRRAMPTADQTHWVKPASLAGVILFLASEAARDQRGAVIPVYGSA